MAAVRDFHNKKVLLKFAFSVEKAHILEYNKFQKSSKNPGMCEAPFIFEPTLTLRESKIADWMSDLSSWQAEELLRTPTWLRLGVKEKGTAFREIII